MDAATAGELERTSARAALASEASGQRGNSISARAGHSPEPDTSARAALASEASGQRGNSISARVPVCYVVDDDTSSRHFVSLILHGTGVDTGEFVDGAALAEAMAGHDPEVVFLNIGVDSSETIETILMLAKRGYFGFVQLMSRRGSAVLEHVKGVGKLHGLNMLPVLKKPFDSAAILRIMQQLKLGHPATVSARIDLGEALANNWIEFWFQPKIDLRKKRLAGVEAFARARHPQFGVLSPNAFMPSANEAGLAALAELALVSALNAAASFFTLGINLRFAVNIPANALEKLPITEIVHAHCPPIDNWAGLIIDVAEREIVSDLALAADIAKRLKACNVNLAIDNFGRSYSTLARLKALPFSELKLDPVFVSGCATDKVNAPLCKTVIDLAHRFGSVATAIGVETASDALALTSMGCDMGQGYLLGQPMPLERFMSLLRQRAAGVTRAAAPAALTSEASGQRGQSTGARAGHSPEPGSSVRATH